MKKLPIVLSTVLISLVCSSCGPKQELTESVVCTKNGENYSKIDYEYNEYADTTLFLTSLWSKENAEWQNSEKKVCEYDELGRRISETTYHFNQETKDWQQVQKKQFEYNGSLLTRISSDKESVTFQYDDAKLLKKIIRIDEYGTKQIEVLKYKPHNDNPHKKVSYYNKIRNRNIISITYYDSGRPLKSYGYSEEGYAGIWSNEENYCERYEYEYNYNGNLSKTEETECVEGGLRITTYEYNERQQIIEELSKYSFEEGCWEYTTYNYQYEYFKQKVKTRDSQLSIDETDSVNKVAETDEDIVVSQSKLTQHPFSVSYDNKVVFSPGNLQYKPSTGKWRFALTQDDYIGNNNKFVAYDYDDWIDLFGWGTGDDPTKTSDNNSAYSTFTDWGSNKIGNDAANTWRTLSIDEWSYLINRRNNASQLFGFGTIAYVKGMIILPDDWQTPEGVSFTPNTNRSLVRITDGFYLNRNEDNYDLNDYSLFQWEKMECAGAVFFPASGARQLKEMEDVQVVGLYWLNSQYNGSNAYVFCFGRDALMQNYSNSNDVRYIGQAVRLVKDYVSEGNDDVYVHEEEPYVKTTETAERIVIDKPALQLRVYGADDNLIASFGIACGRNKGNKMGNGDCKTPEGDFHVCKIQDASSWCHDFKDGAGLIKGAYGPYFFRLEGETLPAKTGIGIHGTHNPNSIGTRCTEGCIRLRNEDLLTLHKYIRVGIPVKILPD